MEKTIFDAIRMIPETAQKEGWLLTFDKDEGTLFYSPEEIPSETELHQITDESAIYLDKNFHPHGLMIEYYKVNFIEHHPAFKDLTDKIFRDKNDEVIVKNPEKKDKDVLLFQSLLESTIIAEAFTNPL